MGVTGTYSAGDEAFLHPAASAILTVAGKRTGALGQIHPRAAKAFANAVRVTAGALCRSARTL